MTKKYYALIGRALSYAGQFLVILILPLVLTPELFAEYNLLVPALTLGSSIIYGWMNGAAFRWSHKIVSKNKNLIRNAISMYYLFFMILSLLTSAACVVAGYKYEAIFPIVIFCISIKDYFMKLSNSAEDYRAFAMANGYLLLGKILFVSSMFYLNIDNLTWVVIAFLLSEIIFIVPFLKEGNSFKHIRVSRILFAIRRMFSYGGPLIAASLAVWLVSLSDRYILAHYASPYDVANYVLTYQFSANIVTIPLMFFITVYYPKLIRMEREDGLENALKFNQSMLKKYLKWSPLYGVVAVAAIWALLTFVYHKYTADIYVIILIVSAQLVCGAAHFYNKKYELNNKTHYIALAVFFAALLNISMNLVVIPTVGALGAACSSLLAYIFLMYVTNNIDRVLIFRVRGVRK
jgi:O-antigen/teichoic acid export membrane protein